MQPGLVLQRPQLQLASQVYPHPSQFPGVGAGGGGGAGVGGEGGVPPPHHFALPPPLQGPRHVVLVMQPGLVLQRPQLQLASQMYPQPSQTAAEVTDNAVIASAHRNRTMART